MQEMIIQCIRNQLKFHILLADSWFASSDNMLFIHRGKKFFLMDMKSQSPYSIVTKKDRSSGNWIRLDDWK